MGPGDQRPPDDNQTPDRDDALASGTESVERYRRAHEVIERMRSDARPDRSGASDDDPRLDSTAALLRAATPGAAEVDPAFAARLFTQLEAARSSPRARPQTGRATQPATPAPGPTRTRVSRRGLMLSGLGAAAAAVIGGAAGAAFERASEGAPQARIVPPAALIPDGVGAWVAVANAADVPVGTVRRFQTEAVVGYLRHTADGFVALSGVCTHMACLLQWNGVDRTFDCPCHGSRFLETGQQAPGAPYQYAPLPPIKTKVDLGQVWVYVISTSGSTPESTGPAATTTPDQNYGH